MAPTHTNRLSEGVSKALDECYLSSNGFSWNIQEGVDARGLRKLPQSTHIHKDPIESLNELCQRLMAPVAFLVLVAWTYLNYIAQTILTNPIVSGQYPSHIAGAALLEGPELVSLGGTSLCAYVGCVHCNVLPKAR